MPTIVAATHLKTEELFVRWLSSPRIRHEIGVELDALRQNTWRAPDLHAVPSLPPIDSPPAHRTGPSALGTGGESDSSVPTTKNGVGAGGVGGIAYDRDVGLSITVTPAGRSPRRRSISPRASRAPSASSTATIRRPSSTALLAVPHFYNRGEEGDADATAELEAVRAAVAVAMAESKLASLSASSASGVSGGRSPYHPALSRLTASGWAKIAEACRLTPYAGPSLAAFALKELGGGLDKHRGITATDSTISVTAVADEFCAWWSALMASHPTRAQRFVHVLRPDDSAATGAAAALRPEEWRSFVDALLNQHPGLEFLLSLPEFCARYTDTVIARLYYGIDRHWSGLITPAALERSCFFEVTEATSRDADINAASDYYPYEHFYVIYTTFWKLDTDHDLVLTRDNLDGYGDGGLPTRILDAVVEGSAVAWRKPDKEASQLRRAKEKSKKKNEKRHRRHRHDCGGMSYWDFCWFMLSEEDKTTPTSQEYWFRILDTDGDGIITLYDLELLYGDTAQRLAALGGEPLPFRDCICLALDMLSPRLNNANQVRLRDIKRCGSGGVFLNTFLNADKFLQHEERDQFQALQDREDGVAPQSDWDRFAWQQYDILAAEEEEEEQGQDAASVAADDGGANIEEGAGAWNGNADVRSWLQ